MAKKTIKDIEVTGKVCLMRVDFNITLDEHANVVNDVRIRASLSTIYNLLGRGARLVLMSHLWRPKAKKTPETSMRIVADHLKRYIQQDTICVADVDDEQATKACIDALQNGELMFFENTRWYAWEKKDIDWFGKYLASFGDIFVNNGFGVCHREHASVVGIAKYLPSVSWLLLEEEIKYMKLTIKQKQARPYVAVIWWKKAEEKIGVTKALLKQVDDILLWGGIANTYLKVMGKEIGTSFYEPNMLEEVQEIMWSAMQKRCGLVMPQDFVVTDAIAEDAGHTVVDVDNIPQDMMTVDIWPKTREKYAKILQKAWFILWIGPMWVYEISAFRGGNDAVMDAIAESRTTSFVGWWDTIASISDHPKRHYISHMSTWWWATLMYLEQWTLPGIEVLEDR